MKQTFQVKLPAVLLRPITRCPRMFSPESSQNLGTPANQLSGVYFRCALGCCPVSFKTLFCSQTCHAATVVFGALDTLASRLLQARLLIEFIRHLHK